MEELKVNQVIISKQGENSANFNKFKEIVNRKHIKVNVVSMEDKLQIENNLYFSILWPKSSNLISENVLNNNSLVMKLQYQQFSMLFTGDIEKIAEQEVIKEYIESNKSIKKDNKENNNILKSSVLKVEHHGSKSSTIQEFLEIIKPKISLIGVGENNKFGHPNEEVLERLEKCGSKIYRTDQSGEISIIVNKKGEIVKINEFIK